MADDGIWTTNAAIQAKAGTNANATAKAAGETDKYVLQVEAMVNILTKVNWSDIYSTLDDDLKQILLEITSNLCAIYVIQWDMSGFTSRTEAEDMVNILRDAALRDMSIVREQIAKDFMRTV